MAKVFQKSSGRERVDRNLYYDHDHDTWLVYFTDPKKWDKKKNRYGAQAFVTLRLGPNPIDRNAPKCRTETEARRALRLVFSGLETGDVVAPSKTTLDEIYVLWLKSVGDKVNAKERERSHRTYKSYEARYRNLIQPVFGSVRCSDITPRMIERFYEEEMQPRWALSTRKDVHRMLGSILRRAVSEGAIGASPMGRVRKDVIPSGKKKRRVDVLSHEQLLALGAHLTDLFRMVVLLIAYTGMRVGEATELRWMDIDWNDEVIRPRRAWADGVVNDGKTEAASIDEREIPMVPFLLEELRLHLTSEVMAGRGGPGDLVCSSNGERFHRNAILYAVKSATKKAGIPNFTTHKLRHTLISHLIAAGADVKTVQGIAGHAEPATTLDIYSHEFAKREKRAKLQAQLASNGFGQVDEGQS